MQTGLGGGLLNLVLLQVLLELVLEGVVGVSDIVDPNGGGIDLGKIGINGNLLAERSASAEITLIAQHTFPSSCSFLMIAGASFSSNEGLRIELLRSPGALLSQFVAETIIVEWLFFSLSLGPHPARILSYPDVSSSL